MVIKRIWESFVVALLTLILFPFALVFHFVVFLYKSFIEYPITMITASLDDAEEDKELIRND